MGRFVIVAYRPKPGRRPDLVAAIARHIKILRDEDLVTEQEPLVMSAVDGTIIQVVEWKSAEAIEKGHRNEAVVALWVEFGEICDFRPLASLREANEMFAEFDSMRL